jgi:hypothetical protein
VIDAFQDDRLGGAIDTADRPPIATPHPYPILMTAQRPSRCMHRERVGGEGLNPGKKDTPVAPRQHSEILGTDWRNDQPHKRITDAADQASTTSCRQRHLARGGGPCLPRHGNGWRSGRTMW